MKLESNCFQKIDIIIVNWNSGSQLRECLASIVAYGKDCVKEVIIVDNNSVDDSLDTIESISLSISIVRNTTNRGFATACNQGASMASCDYLLFLNPDTRLFENSLIKPIAFIQRPENNNVGICGIRLIDENEKTSISAARFPTLRVMTGEIFRLNKVFPHFFPSHLMSPTDLSESGFVDQVSGAFFLIKKHVFDQCNGFDEQFFVYFEEVDLSLRAKQFGYASYFLSDAIAFHKGGGCSEQVKSDRLFFSLRSRILYARKHYSPIEFFMLIVLTGLELPLRLIQGMVRLSWSDIKNTWIAYKQTIFYFI